MAPRVRGGRGRGRGKRGPKSPVKRPTVIPTRPTSSGVSSQRPRSLPPQCEFTPVNPQGPNPETEQSEIRQPSPRIKIVLGCMDLDLALRMDKPTSPTDDSTPEYKAVPVKCERSNRIGLMIIKDTILETFRGGEEMNDLKQFLAEMDLRFARSDKAEISMLLHRFSTMSQLKSNYNTQKEQWSLNELIAYCVQEEDRMKQERTESAHMAYTSKAQGKRKKTEPTKNDAAKGPTQKKHVKGEDTCFFCKKGGHMKKDCHKYHAWRAKKGMFLALVCSEINLVEVPINTWWLDSGATTNISVSLHGCLSYQNPIDAERSIHLANGIPVHVEAIAHFRLCFSSSCFLDLKDTFFVPSFRRNLVSVSYLDRSGYSCLTENGTVTLSLNSVCIGTRKLLENHGLYMFETINANVESLNVESRGTKRKFEIANSGTLWHKRLCHIFRNRVERLVSDGILSSIDFTDFNVCVDCIKEKQTKHKKLGAYRAKEVLELIHTYICGPFLTPSWNGQQYFMSFIDDYSRYAYLFLIHEKSESLDVFKKFKAEVECQLDRRIKSVRSDRGGEYYGRYDGSGEQRPGLFARYLEECGIVPQYTMPGSPSMNGVSERRNRTLKDMVRSMISHSTLPESLWERH
ncbi:unnamed protein product [Arabidopsis lyrata]|nr:unnamed protein product [Arabidopsis lyrata]